MTSSALIALMAALAAQSYSGTGQCPSGMVVVGLNRAGPPTCRPAATLPASAAAMATRLTSDPAACSAGSYVTDQSSTGSLTCSVPPTRLRVNAPLAATDAGVPTVSLTACSQGLGLVSVDGGWICRAEIDPTVPSVWKNDIASFASVNGSRVAWNGDAGSWQSIPAFSFGELYEDLLGSTIALTDAHPTYYPWISGVVGECRGMTCAASPSIITITRSGYYKVNITVTLALDGAGQEVEVALFVQNASGDAGTGYEVAKCASSQRVTNANDTKALAATCIVQVLAGDILTVRFANRTSAGKTLTVKHVSITINGNE